VQMLREESGAAALSGRDLPTDQTLAAHASVCARAQEYKDSGAFPDDTRMDQYRAAAYLDLLNGITAEARIASGQITTVTRTGSGAGASNGAGADVGAAEGKDTATGAATGTGTSANCDQDRDVGDPNAGQRETRRPDAGEPGAGGRDCACRACDGSCLPPDDDFPPETDPDGDGPDDGYGSDGDNPHGYGPDNDGPDDGRHGGIGPRGEPDDGDPDGGPGGKGPGSGGEPGASGFPSAAPGGNPAAPTAPPSDSPSLPRLADLVLPLATLLGLVDRPGESHGLGSLDPELCRELAIAATGSPWTRLCVTVTDSDGIAVGHGCARLARPARRDRPTYPTSMTVPAASGRPACIDDPAGLALSLPARVNLTIPAARLADLAGESESSAPPGQSPWTFTQDDDPGPPGGFGTWMLTLPDGRNLRLNLEPVPSFECDHRHKSHAYKPNDVLRHLVQVRDGDCTFPPCSRHARESDFEHATPYDKGGATCACNAGARSRACHQVKQSPGWNVAQPRPGWHQWRTPSGRTYTQGPKRYPALLGPGYWPDAAGPTTGLKGRRVGRGRECPGGGAHTRSETGAAASLTGTARRARRSVRG
jgi:hypothetical protein